MTKSQHITCQTIWVRGSLSTLLSPLDTWSQYLQGHHDQQVIIFMMYGWPTSYMGDQIPTLDLTNHISATKHPAHVKKFIQKETRLTALMGPFPNTPFTWTRTNPLMARPKKESTDMRIILDLSFPDLRAVNSHIPKVLYEGSPYKLKLPTPLDFSELIVQLGAGAYIYKVDLERAYRQLPADPFDWALLGIGWDSAIYIDSAIPFGLRHGAMACQRVTEAICHTLKQQQGARALAYIDDFRGAAAKSKTTAIILNLGLSISWDKCVTPTQQMSWVGTWFDTLLMLMKIDQDKIQETLELCRHHLTRDDITLHELEVLLGKLLYSSKLATPARRFLNRALQLRRSFTRPGPLPVTPGFKEDLSWFILTSCRCITAKLSYTHGFKHHNISTQTPA